MSKLENETLYAKMNFPDLLPSDLVQKESTERLDGSLLKSIDSYEPLTLVDESCESRPDFTTGNLTKG